MKQKKEEKWSLKQFVLRYHVWILFLLIMAIGMYLRFWHIDRFLELGWDQARDAWKVRDLLHGELVLMGPRTGVGHFHLGPLWFYMLAPFYFLMNFDPAATYVLNFLVNIFNFVAIFWVTRKLFSDYKALFVVLIYAASNYIIQINQVSWNVSPVPGVSVFIFYAIWKVAHGDFKWVPLLAFLTGLFSHLHFAFVFLPPIIILSFVFVKEKLRLLKWGLLSLPLFLIWLVPNVVSDLQTKHSDSTLFSQFLKDYYVGVHLQFFLYRLNDALIQFKTVLHLDSPFRFLEYLLPLGFLIITIFEKNKERKLLEYLICLWFIVPALIYGVYGGSTSEYYMFMTAPLVLYVVLIYQEKLLMLPYKKAILGVLAVVWIGFIYINTQTEWVKRNDGGLMKQKAEVKQRIASHDVIQYNEGDIKAYLYQIWAVKK